MIRSKLTAIGIAFDRLSAREQVMVMFIVVGLSALIIGLASYSIRADLGRRESRIAAKTKQLQELASLQADYQRRLNEQKGLAEEIRKNNEIRLLSYIEEVSKKADIELGNAQERSGEPTGTELLREEAAEVVVKNVSIDRLHGFLEKLESGNRLVRVRRLKIKTRFDNAKRLDAVVTVGTWKTTS